MQISADQLTKSTIRVEWIREDKVFAMLGELWSDLLQHSQSESLFLTHEWLWTWWRHFGHGRRLAVALFRDGDDPIGLAPLTVVGEPRVNGGGKVEFLGEPLSDVHDFIITRKRRECMAALWHALPEVAPDASYVELRLIPESSPNLPALRDGIYPKFWFVEAPLQILEQVAPAVALEGSWDAYFSARRAELRSDVKRQSGRLLCVGDMKLVEHDSPEAIRVLVRQLADFSLKRFAENSVFHDARLLAFYEEFALVILERGWLDAVSLVVGETPIAVHLGFSYRGTLHYYQPGFNVAFQNYSPGKILLAMLIKRAFSKGLKRIDLGRGEERYKSEWATDLNGLCRFELVPKRPQPSAQLVLRRARYLASRTYRALWT